MQISVLLMYSAFTTKFCYHSLQDLEKVVEAVFRVWLIIYYIYLVYWISCNLGVVESVVSLANHSQLCPR